MGLSQAKRRRAIAILFLGLLIAGTAITAYWFLDLDNDGLPYFEEVLRYGTDPLRPDTDGDGLIDGFEVKKHGTNPLNPDTDGDGLHDGKEVQIGTDPLKLNPTVKYFLDKGGSIELVRHIALCDTDEKMSLEEKDFVDFLLNPGLDGLPSTKVAEIQVRLVEQILKDTGVSEDEARSLGLLAQFPGEIQERYSSFSEDVFAYLAMLASLKDREFVDYAVRDKLRMEDGKFTDLDAKFLFEPQRYVRVTLETDMEAIAVVRPDVAMELRRLPDLDPKVVGVKEVEANEDFINSVLQASRFSYTLSNLEKILNEGIRDKRKYCTPLEALLWHYIDYEPSNSNPLEDKRFDLKAFVETTWRHSSVSKNFMSEKWTDFQEVVDRLNSPDLVSIYMWHNIQYVPDPENINQDAFTTFNKKGGDCEDHAMFALYCLIKNGFQYDWFESHSSDAACGLDVQWANIGERSAEGHAVCLYKMNNLFYYLDNRGVKKGSFQSVEDMVKSINRSWKRYTFFDINFRITKEIWS